MLSVLDDPLAGPIVKTWLTRMAQGVQRNLAFSSAADIQIDPEVAVQQVRNKVELNVLRVPGSTRHFVPDDPRTPSSPDNASRKSRSSPSHKNSVSSNSDQKLRYVELSELHDYVVKALSVPPTPPSFLAGLRLDASRLSVNPFYNNYHPPDLNGERSESSGKGSFKDSGRGVGSSGGVDLKGWRPRGVLVKRNLLIIFDNPI